MASGGILYYFQLGGIFMYPLLLLSILRLALVCERYWYYWRHSLGITPLTYDGGACPHHLSVRFGFRMRYLFFRRAALFYP